jgi:hypothetical protein
MAPLPLLSFRKMGLSFMELFHMDDILFDFSKTPQKNHLKTSMNGLKVTLYLKTHGVINIGCELHYVLDSSYCFQANSHNPLICCKWNYETRHNNLNIKLKKCLTT